MKNVAVYSIIAVSALIFLGSLLPTHMWFSSQVRDDYLYNLEMFRDSFEHGNWYPRWYPRLAGGYGYPMLVYYHPGALYLTLPFLYLFHSPVFAFYSTLVLMTFLGGLGAYKLARLYCNDAASLLCMALFYTTHYVPADLFGRGDIPEFFSVMLIPWGLYLIIVMAGAIQNRNLPPHLPVLFTLLTFVLAVMHPFAFLYCVPLAVVALVGKWVESGYNYRIIAIPLLCIAIALALSAPYWYSLLQMKEFVHYRGATFINARVKNLREYFTGGYYNPGRLQFIMALMGWTCALKEGGVFLRCLLGLFVVLVFLMTSLSDFIWEAHTPLSFTQFPWRSNTVLATLELMGIIQLARWGTARIEQSSCREYLPKYCMLAMVALLPLYVFQVTLWPLSDLSIRYKDPFRIWSVMDYESYKRAMEQREFRYLMFYHEFHPKTANYDKLPNRLLTDTPMIQAVHGSQAPVTMDPDSDDYTIRFTVTATGTNEVPVNMLINQMYLPGWQVMVNGQPAPFARKGAASTEVPSWSIGNRGRLCLHFPKDGIYHVVAWYDGPPGWETRNIVIALLVPLLAGALYWQCRRLTPQTAT